MGIENRDYLRDDSASYGYRSSFGGGLVAVKWIIIANIAVFVLQLLTARNHLVTNALALSPGSIVGGFELWRLVTYAFCHAEQGLWHIFFNMLVLYFVGRRLEPRYGTREFFLFYMTAAVISGSAYVVFELLLAQPGMVIGASGAVAAAFILYAIHYPHERWYIFFVIPVEVRWLCLAFIVIDLHPVLLALGGGGPGGNVAHACHLGGYLFGYLYYAKRWHLDSAFRGIKVPKLPRRERNSHLKVYNPHREATETSANLEARVDEILQKIHEHGESSLTAEERSTLSDASRRLRNRSQS